MSIFWNPLKYTGWWRVGGEDLHQIYMVAFQQSRARWPEKRSSAWSGLDWTCHLGIKPVRFQWINSWTTTTWEARNVDPPKVEPTNLRGWPAKMDDFIQKHWEMLSPRWMLKAVGKKKVMGNQFNDFNGRTLGNQLMWHYLGSLGDS